MACRRPVWFHGSGGEWEEAKGRGPGPLGLVGSHGRIWSDVLERPWRPYGEWQCRGALTAEEKPNERACGGGGAALGKRHGISE